LIDNPRLSQAKNKEAGASHRDAAAKADEIAAKSKEAATENVEPTINGVKVGLLQSRRHFGSTGKLMNRFPSGHRVDRHPL
jgi:hypothetical protein